MEPIYNPETGGFFVDCGDLPPEKALAFVEKVREEYLKLRATTDQKTSTTDQ